MEERSGAEVRHLAIELLLPYLFPFLHIKQTDEVGALSVVLNEAGHPSVLQTPAGWIVGQGHEQLNHSSSQGSTPSPQQVLQYVILCRVEQTALAALLLELGFRSSTHSSLRDALLAVRMTELLIDQSVLSFIRLVQ